MNALFDSAGLAIVAYAEVVGATGSSSACNSGVTTARVSAGLYTITLPSDKTQYANRDLMFVQVDGSSTNTIAALVDNTDPAVKVVRTSSASTLVDADFTVLILRTIAPSSVGP
jgi:hypothetical protein